MAGRNPRTTRIKLMGISCPRTVSSLHGHIPLEKHRHSTRPICDIDRSLPIMNLLLSIVSRLLHARQTFRAVGLRSPSPASRARFNWLAGFSVLLALAPGVALAQQITIAPSTIPNPFVGVPYS